MENQEKKVSPPEDADVEMGALINLLIRIIKRISAFFATLFYWIGQVIMYVLMFLKRNLIWIGIAIIIGLVWGIYTDSKHGTKYYSRMIVRTNFGSTRALYNSVDYINALIGERRLKDLSTILSIPEEEAGTLRYLTAEPVDDELSVAELYKQKFLVQNRSDLVRLDTFWARVIKYEDFKKSLTKFDKPFHEITAVSIHPDIFSKIEAGVINAILKNEVLVKNQEINQRMDKDEEQIIISSIQGLDTLRRAYNERLVKQDGSKESGSTNLNVLDRGFNIKTPELDLYDKVLELKDELKTARTNAANNQNIIQVYSRFNPIGQKQNVLKQDSASYTIFAASVALIFLIILDIYKAVGRYEKGKSKKQV